MEGVAEPAVADKAWYAKPRVWLVVGLFLVAALAILIPLAVLYGRAGTLVNAMNTADLRVSLDKLQAIASANGGNREALGPGFNASLDFVEQRLVAAGYAPSRQHFNYSDWQAAAPPALAVAGTAVPPAAFGLLRFSGSANVAASIWAAGAGCSAAEYPAGFKAGDVALVQDGTGCTTDKRVEVAVAQKAGAVVVVQPPPGTDFQGGSLSTLASLPVLVISNLFGTAIASGSNGSSVTISSKTTVQTAYSANLIADTKGGNSNAIVVVGAHLDSVIAGPGINDNGSGSSVVLQLAVELARLKLTPTNRIRFIFFGGEEKGLLGSKYYVSQLGETRFELAMMLDFDMLASPNYFFGVYNGTNSSVGSGMIQKSFEDYAASQKVDTVPIPFDGRSDYGPFLPICPAGGIFTGAEKLKDSTGRTSWGGMDRVAYDPCYHQACDTIENIAWDALGKSAKMAAHVLESFAFRKNLVSSLGR